MNDENIPVIIGTAQLVDRDADVDNFIEPVEMLAQVARKAAEASGVGDAILRGLDTIALVETIGWHPDNPVDLLSARIDASPSRQYVTGTGGQSGTMLINHVASEIVQERYGSALIAGCNNLKVLMKARSVGKRLVWTRGGKGEALMVGTDEPGSNELESQYGLQDPPDIYPLFENAMRKSLGLSIEEHNHRIGNLFKNFTDVAADNPYAWFPVRRNAQELTTVTPANRMISFPYPKYLNAILNTEQAAGVLVCSLAQARRFGVPDHRLVFWRGGASSNEEPWWVSERPDFTDCPAMRDTHVSALANADLDVSDIDYFDFYSCFPIAVEMACKVLDLSIDDPRGFTVTGGLPYAGGPASAYTLHSLSEMVERIISKGGSGMVTGNGWYLTKHAATILSSEPVENPRQGLIDDLPTRSEGQEVDLLATGKGTIEAYTVTYDRDGKPTRGIVLGRTESDRRFLANTPSDIDLLNCFVADEQVGVTGKLIQVEGKTIFHP